MTAPAKQRKNHEMAQNCNAGHRFRHASDSLEDLLATFREWSATHKDCTEDAA